MEIRYAMDVLIRIDKDTSYILDLYKKNEDINIGTIKINKIIRWKQIN